MCCGIATSATKQGSRFSFHQAFLEHDAAAVAAGVVASCRQLEQQEQLGWRKPDFNFYVNYLHRKIRLYDQLAGR